MVALSRNRREIQHRVAPLKVADLEVDALRQRIRLGTREVRLSPHEHIILYTLIASAGVVVTYRELAVALGLSDPVIRNNTIARHVSSLRRKLGDGAEHPHYIETVVGIGYGMRVSPRPALTRDPANGRPLVPRAPSIIAL
jgi:DNA-binding response OmpR family regulator